MKQHRIQKLGLEPRIPYLSCCTVARAVVYNIDREVDSRKPLNVDALVELAWKCAN